MIRVRCVLLAAFVVLLCLATPALAAPTANDSCLSCHKTGGPAVHALDFDVSVDMTKCNACHWYSVHDFDFQHQTSWYDDYMSRQCNSCHHSSNAWPTRPAILDYATALTPSGFFQTLASVGVDAKTAHAIHASGSWLKDVSECANCHGAASCDACHTTPGPTHAEHASVGAQQLPVSFSVGKRFGDAAADTYLYGTSPSSNWNGSTTLLVGRGSTTAADMRILLRFPLARVDAASVSTATVVLTRASGTPFPMRAYRLRRSDWSESQASWNLYKTGASWGAGGAGSPGVDYYPDLFAESSTGVFDVTALVRAALASGSSTLELVVTDPAPVIRRYASFFSNAGVNPPYYPYLRADGSRAINMYAYGPVGGTVVGSDTVPTEMTETRSCVAAACHSLAKAATDDFVPACASCHSDRTAPHGYDAAKHGSAPASATMSVSGASYGTFACGTCHDLELGLEHSKASSSSKTPACGACHPSPRDGLAHWDESCTQGGCHTGSSSAPMHASIDASHALLPSASVCAKAGCHGSNLAAIHSSAATTVAGSERTSCAVCHTATSLPKSSDCKVCHGDVDHKKLHDTDFDAASCNDCHDANLVTEHLTNRGRTCETCHESADVAKQQAIAWGQKGCGDCHDSAHGQQLSASVPASIPLDPAFVWSDPIAADTFGSESWMPATYAAAGGRMAVSNRVATTASAVWAWYAPAMAEQGWTVMSGAPLPGATYFTATFVNGARSATLWCTRKEDHGVGPTSAAGYRLELSWYEEVQR
jgi:hypothetical protein